MPTPEHQAPQTAQDASPPSRCLRTPHAVRCGHPAPLHPRDVPGTRTSRGCWSRRHGVWVRHRRSRDASRSAAFRCRRSITAGRRNAATAPAGVRSWFRRWRKASPSGGSRLLLRALLGVVAEGAVDSGTAGAQFIEVGAAPALRHLGARHGRVRGYRPTCDGRGARPFNGALCAGLLPRSTLPRSPAQASPFDGIVRRPLVTGGLTEVSLRIAVRRAAIISRPHTSDAADEAGTEGYRYIHVPGRSRSKLEGGAGAPSCCIVSGLYSVSRLIYAEIRRRRRTCSLTISCAPSRSRSRLAGGFQPCASGLVVLLSGPGVDAGQLPVAVSPSAQHVAPGGHRSALRDHCSQVPPPQRKA